MKSGYKQDWKECAEYCNVQNFQCQAYLFIKRVVCVKNFINGMW